MRTNDLVGLDFETYSAVDLPRHGLHRYTSTSTFTPLIVSIAQDGTAIQPWAYTIDFTAGFDQARTELAYKLEGKTICAHNAGFEQRVLAAIGIDIPSERFIDSAVLARAMGAGSSLEAAAPQLLGTDKLEAGKQLIKLFSIPGRYQEETGSMGFDRRIIEDHPDEWLQFQVYCEVDACLSLRLVRHCMAARSPRELDYIAITMDMNNTGWPVDVPVVEEMQRRYLENQEVALEEFRSTYDAADLNLNSLPQLKEWCAARGIKASSFDEKHVTKLIERIKQKLDKFDTGQALAAGNQYENYCEVLSLLETKQILGGSSLKKLQVILDTVGKDCRLRDQYLHIGAGQTWRTTGRSVQMQNLKRLAEPADMLELDEPDSEWDNEKLAQNMRQCFTSSHPQGRLVVGDFASVESRGLAWLAGANKKLDAYRQGLDMYKVLATDMFGVAYDDVTKAQRQAGKVGELSCGYQAGGGAVQSFAAGMGIEMSEGEASRLVTDWRSANPEIVALWAELDDALHAAVEGNLVGAVNVGPKANFTVRVYRTTTPASLLKQHPNAVSIAVEMTDPNGLEVLTRYFHGCYIRGNSICYYKPSQRKTGDLWSSHFVDPKTKQVRFFSIYGGKLAGILTQSFCREIFFRSLAKVHAWLRVIDNVDLVGQFHDEIVVDWRPPVGRMVTATSESTVWNPGQVDLDGVILGMNLLMSDATDFPGFPLEADIKYDYRYTK